MFELTILKPNSQTTRGYPDWTRAKKAFYNAVYTHVDARVTLANAQGKIIRIGRKGKTEASSNEDSN